MKPIPDHVKEFAEEISALQGNPNCKTCSGRFYKGVSISPSGTKTLNKCYCARLGETEYVRLAQLINANFEALAADQAEGLKQMSSLIIRYTGRGSIIYFVMVVLRGNVVVQKIAQRFKKSEAPATPSVEAKP